MADPPEWQEDPRGVLRGACSVCNCPCYGRGPGGATKCGCGHPPGKHMKFGEDMKMDVDAHTTSQESDMVSKNTQVESEWLQSLPLCAAKECDQRVHYDHRLPQGMELFKYCSPQCRDTMLEGDKENLQRDISDMEHKLKSLKTVLTYPSNPSNPSNRKQTVPATEKVTTKSGDKAGSSVGQPLGPIEKTPQPKKTPHPKKMPQPKPLPKQSGSSDPKKSKRVKFKKFGKEDLGLFFSSDFYRTDSSAGMVITGVRRNSSVYTEFQSDSIRFLDIITSIDGTTVSEVTMGNCYSMIADNTEVTLDLLQIGLPPMSRVLANAKHYDQWTHVFALRCTAQGEVGIALNLAVGDEVIISRESTGRTNGLNCGDRIFMYATATDQDKVHSAQRCVKSQEKFKDKIRKEMEQNESYMLLFIGRSLQTNNT